MRRRRRKEETGETKYAMQDDGYKDHNAMIKNSLENSDPQNC